MSNRSKIRQYKGDWAETFYKSEEWYETRDIILARDEFRCRVCGSGEELSVHHIVPRVYIKDVSFDIDALNNLLTLCWKCHKMAERKKKPGVYKK